MCEHGLCLLEVGVRRWCTILGMEPLRRLRGMRDQDHRSWLELAKAQERLRDFFSLHGYRVLDTPMLEPTGLFLRKSGGDVASQLYSFSDPGGVQVSLRPEFTASIIRRHVQNDGGQNDCSDVHPARVQYAGPVFRYSPASHNSDDSQSGQPLRQFTQVGVELLDAPGPKADAEIMALSWNALRELGISGHRLVIGDLGLLTGILESLDLSERASSAVLRGLSSGGSIDDFIKSLSDQPGDGRMAASLAGMNDEEAGEMLGGLLEWTGAGSLGQRQPHEVVDRLLQKFRGSDDPGAVSRAAELVGSLSGVRGSPDEALPQARQIVGSNRAGVVALDKLEEAVSWLSVQIEPNAVTLDFGLVRELAYYTDVVFEIRSASGEGLLGGGGRYDGLARALGSGRDIPAMGFAYTSESLLESLALESAPSSPAPESVLVTSEDGDGYRHALAEARLLRDQGINVELDLSESSLEHCLAHARVAGLDRVVVVDSEGNSESHRA